MPTSLHDEFFNVLNIHDFGIFNDAERVIDYDTGVYECTDDEYRTAVINLRASIDHWLDKHLDDGPSAGVAVPEP